MHDEAQIETPSEPCSQLEAHANGVLTNAAVTSELVTQLEALIIQLQGVGPDTKDESQTLGAVPSSSLQKLENGVRDGNSVNERLDIAMSHLRALVG